tara:strand:+ start:692 stop:1033 length:342 start_codon:yes stop_codon:yes gene_type:complete
MITYEWNCKTVNVYPQKEEVSNLVYNVHWIVTGTSDQLDENGNPYTSRNIGTQSLSSDNTDSFLPFEDLTNEIASGWVKSAIGAERVSSIESGIESKINDLITPKSITLQIGG